MRGLSVHLTKFDIVLHRHAHTVLVLDIPADTDSNAKRSRRASRPPGPSRRSADREVVEPKCRPSKDEAHQRAEKNVEAVVSEVRVARRRYVDGDTEGDYRQHEKIERGRGGLVAESGLGVAAFGLDAGEGGGHGGAGGVRVGEEVGDIDCEFGAEEEGEEG